MEAYTAKTKIDISIVSDRDKKRLLKAGSSVTVYSQSGEMCFAYPVDNKQHTFSIRQENLMVITA